MSRIPGLQYPSHLVESNPTDAALKVVFDNLFYVRKSIADLIANSSSTLTQQQISQLVTQIINNTSISGTTVFTVGLHATRLTTTPLLGTGFYETDREAIYIGSDGTGSVLWTWAGGNMIATLASRPVDLGVPDKGFVFTQNDADQETQYVWTGTEFITAGGYLQEVADAITNTITTLQVLRHSTSGAAAQNFGGGVVTQLEDSGGTNQTAAYDTVFWSNAGTTSSARQWWLRVLGVLTTIMGLEANGDLTTIGKYIMYAATAFWGKLTHANTGNRTYTFADADGNIVYEDAALVNNEFTLGSGGAKVKSSGFTIVPVASGGTGDSTAAGARNNLGAAEGSGIGAGTVTLAKITGGGTDGSLDWNDDGCITAVIAPT